MSDVREVTVAVLGLYFGVYALAYGSGLLFAYFRTAADMD